MRYVEALQDPAWRNLFSLLNPRRQRPWAVMISERKTASVWYSAATCWLDLRLGRSDIPAGPLPGAAASLEWQHIVLRNRNPLQWGRCVW